MNKVIPLNMSDFFAPTGGIPKIALKSTAMQGTATPVSTIKIPKLDPGLMQTASLTAHSNGGIIASAGGSQPSSNGKFPWVEVVLIGLITVAVIYVIKKNRENKNQEDEKINA